MPQVQFNSSQNTYLDRHESIRADLLDNPSEEGRTLLQSLSLMFTNIFSGASGRELKLYCSYQYQSGKGLPEIDLPVLQIPAMYSEDLSQSVAAALKNWYREADVVAEQGTFVFDLTVFSNRAAEKRPVLKLRRLLLPLESISDMNVI